MYVHEWSHISHADTQLNHILYRRTIWCVLWKNKEYENAILNCHISEMNVKATITNIECFCGCESIYLLRWIDWLKYIFDPIPCSFQQKVKILNTILVFPETHSMISDSILLWFSKQLNAIECNFVALMAIKLCGFYG